MFGKTIGIVSLSTRGPPLSFNIFGCQTLEGFFFLLFRKRNTNITIRGLSFTCGEKGFLSRITFVSLVQCLLAALLTKASLFLVLCALECCCVSCLLFVLYKHVYNAIWRAVLMAITVWQAHDSLSLSLFLLSLSSSFSFLLSFSFCFACIHSLLF